MSSEERGPMTLGCHPEVQPLVACPELSGSLKYVRFGVCVVLKIYSSSMVESFSITFILYSCLGKDGMSMKQIFVSLQIPLTV